jgi:hypothetical protein
MNPNTGEYRQLGAGEMPGNDEVLIVGTRAQVDMVSHAIKVARRKKAKAARRARRAQR